jgi:hypothetical protein
MARLKSWPITGEFTAPVWLARGSQADTRLRGDPRSHDGGFRKELAAGGESAHEPAATNGFIHSTAFGLTGSVPVFGSHGFLSERKFSIHKVPLETYMSKLCVYFRTAPSEGFVIQLATMWKTHTPTPRPPAALGVGSRRA